jgi:hypothetical protein
MAWEPDWACCGTGTPGLERACFRAFALPAYCGFPAFFGWQTSLESFGLP